MYRRRRPRGEHIAFGFDSFLDVVANVIGVIVRLILVAWVGARSYQASMQWTDADPVPVASRPAPRAADDPLHAELERARRDIEESRRRLAAQLARLQIVENQAEKTRGALTQLASRRQELASQVQTLAARPAGQDASVTLSLAELRERGDRLREEIKRLEAQPAPRKELRYHAPVSRTVHADEMFFECKNGRVTYIDLPVFLQEVRQNLEGRGEELKSRWQVAAVTAPVGAFRLRYTLEREKSALESLGAAGPAGGGFRYGVSEWVLEPLAPERGEPLEAALGAGSQFRRLADPLDPRITVVTFWFYPDSFELFRRLRDHLYDRGIEVAGRPLPEGAPIAASRHGTASRAQ